MDDAALVDRWVRSRVAGYRALTACADDGQERELAGGSVRAFRVPAAGALSVVNGVLADDADALLDRLDELRDWYAGAAWIVWLASWQTSVAPGLAAAGLVRDDTAELMAAPLADLDLEARRDLDLDARPAAADLAAVADAGFGLPPGMSFASVLRELGVAALRAWVARDEGLPVASAVFVTAAEDVWFALVATRPSHRRRGLSAELMRTALRAARGAGATSSSLEASQAGRPVYRALGYRELGAIELWEHPGGG